MKHISLLLLSFPLIAHASLFSHDPQTLSRPFRDHSQLTHHANAHHLKKSSRNNLGNSGSSSQKSQVRSAAKGSSIKVTGVLNIQSDCGDIGATNPVTEDSGPNGSEHWLNYGINEGGWRPPHVNVNDLITEQLSEAIETSSSPFQACKPYVQFFENTGWRTVPSILLAAIALQESNCKSDATGGAGEQGLMQITKDKCFGAPGGNCKSPDYNIKTGAKFFSDTLASNGGNVIETIGMYNGWKQGLTYFEATAAASGSCCRCQNNLDYIHQTVNGWLRNKNVYDNIPRIGVYFNLDNCGD